MSQKVKYKQKEKEQIKQQTIFQPQKPIPQKNFKNQNIQQTQNNIEQQQNQQNKQDQDQDPEKKKKKKKNKNKKQDLKENPQKKIKTNNQNQIQSVQIQKKQEQKQEVEEKDDTTIKYPYIVDKEDHCESPLDSYQDISLILMEIARQLNKSNSELKIYDPYYCQGRVKENFQKIGFTNVYNKKEDFYKVIENNDLPEYDVLVTNPPYSEDHIQKIYEFCVKQKKPWFILAPNYCYIKDWYMPTLKKSEPWCKPFYLIPDQRYFYLKEGKKTSPFLSMWYIYLPNNSNEILENCREKMKQYRNVQIIKNIQKIPDNYKDSNDPTRKKLRKNQKKNRKSNKN